MLSRCLDRAFGGGLRLGPVLGHDLNKTAVAVQSVLPGDGVRDAVFINPFFDLIAVTLQGFPDLMALLLASCDGI